MRRVSWVCVWSMGLWAALGCTEPAGGGSGESVSQDDAVVVDTESEQSEQLEVVLEPVTEPQENIDSDAVQSVDIMDTEDTQVQGDSGQPDDVLDVAESDAVGMDTSEDVVDPCGDCGPEQVCTNTGCADVICTPGVSECDESGLVSKCGPLGSQIYTFPCAAGFVCHKGQCTAPPANVLLIFDTSGSMDDTVGSGGMHPWPACESPANPVTKIGVSKAAFTAFLGTSPAQPLRFSLLRFPQVEQWTSFPNCSSGYYSGFGKMSDDPDAHITSLSPDWFSANMGEVVVEPFDTQGEDKAETILAWMDGSEAIAPLDGVGCNACGGVCESSADQCYEHTDPELRPDGWTPIGRTLFYAGEYLRRFVLLDGKPCEVNEDCGSADYVCSDGECSDPVGACRETMILLFTDGEETESTWPTSYFYPVNQAKRLRMGLSCAFDNDCAPGSFCQSGSCQLLSGTSLTAEVLSDQMLGVCDNAYAACELGNAAECDNFGQCVLPDNTFHDGEGIQTLRGWKGQPLGVTVHVIDASPSVSEANLETAFWGGGQYLKVDVADLDSILSAIVAATDIKPNLACQ